MEDLIQIVREAGNIILEADLNHDFNQTDLTDDNPMITSKEGRANFVTKYDLLVQNFLFDQIKKLYPDAKFIGEEDDKHPSSMDGRCFIIDPIDGTSNFIFDNKFSAISVAMMEDGEVTAGIVYNPYLDELFYAKKGEKAYLNQRVLQVKPLPLKDSLAAFGTSPYEEKLADQSFEIARKLLNHVVDIRRCGSAALDICYVAANRYSFFFELQLSPWDFAAASLILQEAGGKITTFDKKELFYEAKTSIVAANPVAYQEFYQFI